MQSYLKVYEEVGLSDTVISFALGNRQLPVVGVEQPARAYGFPPALIPLWSDPDGPFLFGYWQHWFGIDREPSFVKMYLDSGRSVVEFARTFDQLVRMIAMESMCVEGAVTPELKGFAYDVAIDDLEVVDALTDEFGDDASALLSLDSFKERAPLICFPGGEGYEGSFPNSAMPLNSDSSRRISSFEVEPDLAVRIGRLKPAPVWLIEGHRPTSFWALYDGEDFAGAWMALNSTGWVFEEAEKALKALVQSTADPAFQALAEAWSRHMPILGGGY